MDGLTALRALTVAAAGLLLAAGCRDHAKPSRRIFVGHVRVGVVHAVSNVVALGLFTASWRARSADRHVRGTALGLAASSALGVGGLLGGHLVSARKVSSRHPDFEE